MTQLKQPPYAGSLVWQQTGMLTDRWQEWFSLVRRYLRAELITATTEESISMADGANQSITVALIGAEQGQVALGSLDDAVPAGILLSAHAGTDEVTVTLRNESGGAYSPGTITVRATTWRH